MPLDKASSSLRTVFSLVIPERNDEMPTSLQLAIAFEDAGIPVGEYEYLRSENAVQFLLMPRRGESVWLGQQTRVDQEDIEAIQQVLLASKVSYVEIKPVKT